MNILPGRGAALALALLAAARPASGAAVSLEAEGEGAFRLRGSFPAAASAATAWEVLTDYEGLPRFVSSMRVSRLVGGEPGSPVVEQRGSGRFLFMSRDVLLRLAVREEAPARIAFRDVDGGQFSLYEGSWSIAGAGPGCVVSYDLAAAPRPALGPAFVARRALKAGVERLLEEVRAEMERRAKEAL